MYGSLALGLLLGHWWPGPHRYVGAATPAVVALLVLLLGLGLSGLALPSVLAALPLALGLLAVGFGLAVLLARGWVRRRGRHPSEAAPTPRRALLLGPTLLLVLVLGYGFGAHVPAPPPLAVPAALDALVFLVALEARPSRADVRGAIVPITAAMVGATVAGTLVALLAGWPISLGLAIAWGFGWYSLTGPLVALQFGSQLGLVAFLANFLRESATMLLSPVLGRAGGAEAIAAGGGAASMDTTLYFVQRFGGSRGAGIGLSTGLVLTIAAAIAVPAFLSL